MSIISKKTISTPQPSSWKDLYTKVVYASKATSTLKEAHTTGLSALVDHGFDNGKLATAILNAFRSIHTTTTPKKEIAHTLTLEILRQIPSTDPPISEHIHANLEATLLTIIEKAATPWVEQKEDIKAFPRKIKSIMAKIQTGTRLTAQEKITLKKWIESQNYKPEQLRLDQTHLERLLGKTLDAETISCDLQSKDLSKVARFLLLRESYKHLHTIAVFCTQMETSTSHIRIGDFMRVRETESRLTKLGHLSELEVSRLKTWKSLLESDPAQSLSLSTHFKENSGSCGTFNKLFGQDPTQLSEEDLKKILNTFFQQKGAILDIYMGDSYETWTISLNDAFIDLILAFGKQVIISPLKIDSEGQTTRDFFQRLPSSGSENRPTSPKGFQRSPSTPGPQIATLRNKPDAVMDQTFIRQKEGVYVGLDNQNVIDLSQFQKICAEISTSKMRGTKPKNERLQSLSLKLIKDFKQFFPELEKIKITTSHTLIQSKEIATSLIQRLTPAIKAIGGTLPEPSEHLLDQLTMMLEQLGKTPLPPQASTLLTIFPERITERAESKVSLRELTMLKNGGLVIIEELPNGDIVLGRPPKLRATTNPFGPTPATTGSSD